MLARHNFEGEVAFIGMDDEEEGPIQTSFPKTGIELDLQQMRDRLNSDPQARLRGLSSRHSEGSNSDAPIESGDS